MAALSFLCCFLILLLCFQCICISGKWAAEEQISPSSSSNGGRGLNPVRKLEDSLNQPGTTLPSTTPITNPANLPPYTPTPTIITVPASNPTSLTPTNPNSNPITTVPTTPTTNPAAPVTDPDATNPAAVAGTGGLANAPIVPGQTWCIARTGAPESSLQSALDYACGIGGADCSMIQQGASCYNPNSLENHASYAFNSYFQKNPVPTSCDFGGSAVLVNSNPSTGSCVYPSSATTSAMPSSTIPPATPTNVPASTIPPATPTNVPSSTIPPITTSPGATGSTYGVPGSGGFESPPSVLGANNPASGSPGIFGLGSPPTSSNSMPAGSVVAAASRPLTGFLILVAFLTTGKLILDA